MNLKRDGIWAYRCPSLADLQRLKDKQTETKFDVMWLSRWLDGNTLQDVLNRCVPLHAKILSIRELQGSKPEAEVTILVTSDTPHGSLRRECAAIDGRGLLELVAGTILVLHHYDEDRTAEVTQINPADIKAEDFIGDGETKTETDAK